MRHLGVRKDFLGLVDEHDRVFQFSHIPDEVDDPSDLAIVRLDFPVPGRQGSYGRTVTVGEVPGRIDRAFATGVDPGGFGRLDFESW